MRGLARAFSSSCRLPPRRPRCAYRRSGWSRPDAEVIAVDGIARPAGPLRRYCAFCSFCCFFRAFLFLWCWTSAPPAAPTAAPFLPPTTAPPAPPTSAPLALLWCFSAGCVVESCCASVLSSANAGTDAARRNAAAVATAMLSFCLDERFMVASARTGSATDRDHLVPRLQFHASVCMDGGDGGRAAVWR